MREQRGFCERGNGEICVHQAASARGRGGATMEVKEPVRQALPGTDQLEERLTVKGYQFAVGDGGHSGRPRDVRKQANLAEELAVALLPQNLRLSAFNWQLGDFNTAGGNDIEAIGALALADDDVAGVDRQNGRRAHRRLDRSRIEATEKLDVGELLALIVNCPVLNGIPSKQHNCDPAGNS